MCVGNCIVIIIIGLTPVCHVDIIPLTVNTVFITVTARCQCAFDVSDALKRVSCLLVVSSNNVDHTALQLHYFPSLGDPVVSGIPYTAPTQRGHRTLESSQ